MFFHVKYGGEEKVKLKKKSQNMNSRRVRDDIRCLKLDPKVNYITRIENGPELKMEMFLSKIGIFQHVPASYVSLPELVRLILF